MAQVVDQLHKWKKARERDREPEKKQIGCPELDGLLNWGALDPEAPTPADLFSREQEVEITAREFVCLVLFYRLYFCILDIYEFALSFENLAMLMAYDWYSKAHNYIVEAIGTARFGILDEVLERLSQNVITD
jgi:hypothetical protein